tara:strand:+ start:96 stop:536 length:441 start_codon:yes stop_codon:yes gene_type:complete
MREFKKESGYNWHVQSAWCTAPKKKPTKKSKKSKGYARAMEVVKEEIGALPEARDKSAKKTMKHGTYAQKVSDHVDTDKQERADVKKGKKTPVLTMKALLELIEAQEVRISELETRRKLQTGYIAELKTKVARLDTIVMRAQKVAK